PLGQARSCHVRPAGADDRTVDEGRRRGGKSRSLHLSGRGALLLLPARDPSGRAGLRPTDVGDHDQGVMPADEGGRAMALPFDTEEYANRLQRLTARMREEKLDAMLLFAQESMYWLTGFDSTGYAFFQTLVVT